MQAQLWNRLQTRCLAPGSSPRAAWPPPSVQRRSVVDSRLETSVRVEAPRPGAIDPSIDQQDAMQRLSDPAYREQVEAMQRLLTPEALPILQPQLSPGELRQLHTMLQDMRLLEQLGSNGGSSSSSGGGSAGIAHAGAGALHAAAAAWQAQASLAPTDEQADQPGGRRTVADVRAMQEALLTVQQLPADFRSFLGGLFEGLDAQRLSDLASVIGVEKMAKLESLYQEILGCAKCSIVDLPTKYVEISDKMDRLQSELMNSASSAAASAAAQGDDTHPSSPGLTGGTSSCETRPQPSSTDSSRGVDEQGRGGVRGGSAGGVGSSRRGSVGPGRPQGGGGVVGGGEQRQRQMDGDARREGRDEEAGRLQGKGRDAGAAAAAAAAASVAAEETARDQQQQQEQQQEQPAGRAFLQGLRKRAGSGGKPRAAKPRGRLFPPTAGEEADGQGRAG